MSNEVKPSTWTHRKDMDTMAGKINDTSVRRVADNQSLPHNGKLVYGAQPNAEMLKKAVAAA
jgi:hypothetical protein